MAVVLAFATAFGPGITPSAAEEPRTPPGERTPSPPLDCAQDALYLAMRCLDRPVSYEKVTALIPRQPGVRMDTLCAAARALGVQAEGVHAEREALGRVLRWLVENEATVAVVYGPPVPGSEARGPVGRLGHFFVLRGLKSAGRIQLIDIRKTREVELDEMESVGQLDLILLSTRPIDVSDLRVSGSWMHMACGGLAGILAGGAALLVLRRRARATGVGASGAGDKARGGSA